MRGSKNAQLDKLVEIRLRRVFGRGAGEALAQAPGLKAARVAGTDNLVVFDTLHANTLLRWYRQGEQVEDVQKSLCTPAIRRLVLLSAYPAAARPGIRTCCLNWQHACAQYDDRKWTEVSTCATPCQLQVL